MTLLLALVSGTAISHLVSAKQIYGDQVSMQLTRIGKQSRDWLIADLMSRILAIGFSELRILLVEPFWQATTTWASWPSHIRGSLFPVCIDAYILIIRGLTNQD